MAFGQNEPKVIFKIVHNNTGDFSPVFFSAQWSRWCSQAINLDKGGNFLKIDISSEAVEWFKEEMKLQKGDFVKFHARYGGESPLHQGFSLGISNHEPETIIAAGIEKEGITFYVLEADLWFFDGHDFYVIFNERTGELEFKYIKP
jgi:uncharacterized protein YneR